MTQRIKAIGHRACHWWAQKNGMAVVNARHLDAMLDELRRVRHGVYDAPDLSAFGRETP